MNFSNFLNSISQFQNTGNNKIIRKIFLELCKLEKPVVIKYFVDYFCIYIPSNDIDEIFLFFDSINLIKSINKMDEIHLLNLLYITTTNAQKNDKFREIIDRLEDYKTKIKNIKIPSYELKVYQNTLKHITIELDDIDELVKYLYILYHFILNKQKYYACALAFIMNNSKKKINITNTFTYNTGNLKSVDKMIWKLLFMITNKSKLIDRLYYIYSFSKNTTFSYNLLLYCVFSVCDSIEAFFDENLNSNTVSKTDLHRKINEWIKENKLNSTKNNMDYLNIITYKS